MSTRPTLLHVWVGSPRACWPDSPNVDPRKPQCSSMPRTTAVRYGGGRDAPSAYGSSVQRRYSNLGATLNNVYMDRGPQFVDTVPGYMRNDYFVSWHPGPKGHQYVADLTMFYLLSALKQSFNGYIHQLARSAARLKYRYSFFFFFFFFFFYKPSVLLFTYLYFHIVHVEYELFVCAQKCEYGGYAGRDARAHRHRRSRACRGAPRRRPLGARVSAAAAARTHASVALTLGAKVLLLGSI
jgi:hypothetical protein